MSDAQGIRLPTIRTTTVVPDKGRGRGRQGEASIYQQLMVNMPAPAPGKGKNASPQYSYFFVPAEVPPTITDPAERDKAAKDGCAKLVNRFTQMSRRIRKTNGETHDYTFRKARDPDGPADDTAEWGVVVYRIEPGQAKSLIRRAA
jgi:hypothetical protein